MKNKNKIVLIGLALIGAFTLLTFQLKSNEEVKYVYNPNLKTIHPDTDWQGTPFEDGMYKNLYTPFENSFADLLKWQMTKNPQKQDKKADKRVLRTIKGIDFLNSSDDMILWLGHASFFIRLSGTTFLIDPIFFDSPFLKRASELPFSPDELDAIDYILISHDHRDHCDEKTLRFLGEQLPDAKVLTGLDMGGLLSEWMPNNEIEEAGWYQEYNSKDFAGSLVFVPARHWARRGLTDLNQRLWGGFFLKTEDKSIFYMGDSGNDPHFEDIARICGQPDYCIMGVGAFKPEWFMAQAHISPMDAVDAFHRMGGKHFIPMHYGTFDLSDEPLLEPQDWLNENSRKIKGDLRVLSVGEPLHLESDQLDETTNTSLYNN
ncbi:MAG: MBL fold metallo-hydrolase [Cyclobacteriaceae bacterium]|nr:MBL fold metallo-hydrolase [Cyclobacteriaceae bacterium]MCH8517924.1 MBL fold metallo-hydrolase [Cyclobacteriaceae bacterium]